MKSISLITTSCLLQSAVAFTPSLGFKSTSTSTLMSRASDNELQSTSSLESRRDLLTNTLPSLLLASAMQTVPVYAEDEMVDDLAMPSPEDEKKKADAEMEERIRRKRELQKKATRPATFQASLSAELDKKKDLQKSKEERRNALCEELGRGC